VQKDQTAPALALALGLAPERHRETILRQLAASIADRGGHPSTGVVGTRWLLDALAENGRADLAVNWLTAAGFPGFLHMIRNGATTVWEDWRGESALNHAGLSSPARWLYEGLAGIRPDPAAPGFQRIVVKPAPVAKPRWVEAWQQSLRGRVAVRRETADGRMDLSVTIPPNCTAEVHLPAVDSGQVTESGKPASQRPGIRFLRQEGRAAVFETGSGDFRFAARIS
jgi:alpha-L-rhamnosidase